MIKKTLVTGALALFTLTSTVFGVSAAGPATTNDPVTAPAAIVAAPASLNAEEAAGLQFMREEEKLAHDVYVALGATRGLRVFDNIAASIAAAGGTEGV